MTRSCLESSRLRSCATPVPRRLLAMGIAMLGATVLTASLRAQHVWPEDTRRDDLAFREAVRTFGLGDWMKVHDNTVPASSDIDRRIRQRDRLLREAEDESLGMSERRERLSEAAAVIDDLLAQHPAHVSHLSWRILAAEDRLHRLDSRAFRRVLLYEMPLPDHADVARYSGEAVEHLHIARREITRRWNEVGRQSETDLAWLKETGVIRELEQADRRTRELSLWAPIYAALSTRNAGADEPTSTLKNNLDQLAPTLETTSPRSATGDKARDLLAAALMARLLNQPADALRYARMFIETYRDLTSPEQKARLRWMLLPAALERVRAERDLGRMTDALKMLTGMKNSAGDALRNDVEMAWALALLEHRLLLAPAEGVANPDLLSSSAALVPLRETAMLSIRHLDRMYHLFSVALHDAPIPDAPTPFIRQLLAGAAQSHFIAHKDKPDPAITARLETTVDLLDLGAGASIRLTLAQQAEWHYLRGRGLFLLEREDEAVRELGRLAEVAPDYERTPFALEQAAILAHRRLTDAEEKDLDLARREFIEAGRRLRELANRRGDIEVSGRMRFLMAYALEQSERLAEAARLYEQIAPDEDQALVASQRRVDCWIRLLDITRANKPDDENTHRELARHALDAANDAHRLADERDESQGDDQTERCDLARATLLRAHVANLPEIDQPNDVLAVLADFDARFAECGEARADAMSERVTAWVALKRWDDARRALLDRAERGDPEAGPAMAHLLNRMRDAIRDALDQADQDFVTSTSTEAAALADDLLAWSADHPDAMESGDLLTVKTWRAWALLHSGEPASALEAFDKCAIPERAEGEPVSATELEIKLGRAECLLALDKPDDALQRFTPVLETLPVQSDYWWRAYTGSLEAHLRVGSDPQGIVQSIRQQRHLAPDLGGSRWKRRLEAIEQRAKTSARAVHTPSTSTPG